MHYWSLKCYRATKPRSNSGTKESDGQFEKVGEELQVNFDCDAPLGRDPLFLKAGSIIPFREPTDTIPFHGETNLVLWILPDSHAAEFELYDDDRRSYKYEKGEYSTQKFSLSTLEISGIFSLKIGKIKGDHDGIVREKSYVLVIPKSLIFINNVSVNGNSIPIEKSAVNEVSLKINPKGTDYSDSSLPEFIHEGALAAEPLFRNAPSCLEDKNKYVIRLEATEEALLVSFNE